MKDLFGWGSGYVDRYAGLGNMEKYRKLVSKANVGMVLGRFSPFNKAKNVKASTKTIISYDGTNIQDTHGPIDFHPKGNKIYVNNDAMTKYLEKFDEREREYEFINMMKRAYIARSEKESIESRFIKSMNNDMLDDIYDKTTEERKMSAKGMVEVQRQVAIAAQCLIHGIPIVSDSSVRSDAALMHSMDLAHALLSGKEPSSAWGEKMMKDLRAMGKTRGDYNAWMDAFKSACSIDSAGPLYEDTSYKAYEELLSDDIPLTRLYSASPKENNADCQGKSSCEVGNGRMEYNKEPVFAESEKKEDKTYTPTNDILKYDEISETHQMYFFADTPDVGQRSNWKHRDQKMSVLADALYESLVGKLGQNKSQSPAKRLNTKALVSDISDNIYISRQQLGGKHLTVNLILDTSGSMSGTYIEDGTDIINCFNKLAERGVIDGNLMLSCSGASAMMKLPIDPSLVSKLSAHNGGEGFKHTMAIRWQELKNADFNVAITDGQLTDGHIDKEEFAKNGISITGLYVHRGINNDKAQVQKYTGSLSNWFDKSAVRSSTEEAIYYLIDNAILNYDMKGVA